MHGVYGGWCLRFKQFDFNRRPQAQIRGLYSYYLPQEGISPLPETELRGQDLALSCDTIMETASTSGTEDRTEVKSDERFGLSIFLGERGSGFNTYSSRALAR